MAAVARSYVTSGVALLGAGIVTAAQLVPSVSEAQNRVIQAAVNLAAAVDTGQFCSGYNTEGCNIWAKPSYTPVAVDPAGSASNIPANLVNAMLSMPGAWLDGMNAFSYALEVTGNWWVYSPTNVLGFDPADPAKITAMTDWTIPFKALSHPLGDQMAWWARANLPMDESCTGTVGPACHDIGPILSKMFLAPAWKLSSGYQFPTLFNPVSDAEGMIGEEIPGETGVEAPWSGAYVKLDPNDPFTSVMNYLQADPALNAPKQIAAADISAALDRFSKAMVLAFNPVVPMSYLLKGWPYTALTPLFLPFVPLLCPQCNPENPGGPPLVRGSAAAAAPAATLAGDVSDEPDAQDAAQDAGKEVAPAEPQADDAAPKENAATGVPREKSSAPVDSDVDEAADSVKGSAAEDSAREPASDATPVEVKVDAPAAETPEPAVDVTESTAGGSESDGEPAEAAEPAEPVAPKRRGVQLRAGAAGTAVAEKTVADTAVADKAADQAAESVAKASAGSSAGSSAESAE